MKFASLTMKSNINVLHSLQTLMTEKKNQRRLVDMMFDSGLYSTVTLKNLLHKKFLYWRLH